MAISTFRVVWHYEKTAYGGAKHGGFEFQRANVAAASSAPATIAAVLSSAGYAVPTGYVIVFDEISNSGPGTHLS